MLARRSGRWTSYLSACYCSCSVDNFNVSFNMRGTMALTNPEKLGGYAAGMVSTEMLIRDELLNPRTAGRWTKREVARTQLPSLISRSVGISVRCSCPSS